MSACSIEGCSRPLLARGWCATHYARWRRNGAPTLQIRLPFAERVWAKVDRSGGPDACWPWTASTRSSGYGQVGARERGGSPLVAHRVVWELIHGPIPEGYFVLHHCDNPPCCNPAHLFLGTPADNMTDKTEKGRNGVPTKISGEDVRAIRAARAAGEKLASIAARHGVAPTTVCKIAKGRARTRVR